NNEEKINVAKLEASGSIKLAYLHANNNKTITFNYDDALRLDGDTGPYLQYAYVRTKGILRKAEDAKEVPKVANKYILNELERKIVKKIEEFDEVTIKSARDYAPNYIANYLLELASTFNKFYDSNRVLNAEKKEEIETRLAIVKGTNLVLEKGLELLGIKCPQKM
ncbi:MAG: DALR anticodon-binding domain-containing protein, partial [Candidatus Micrarchaeota archaeon]